MKEQLARKIQLPNGQFATQMPSGQIFRDAEFYFSPHFKSHRPTEQPARYQSMHKPRLNEMEKQFFK